MQLGDYTLSPRHFVPLSSVDCEILHRLCFDSVSLLLIMSTVTKHEEEQVQSKAHALTVRAAHRGVYHSILLNGGLSYKY